jgi:hypothetical protein
LRGEEGYVLRDSTVLEAKKYEAEHIPPPTFRESMGE